MAIESQGTKIEIGTGIGAAVSAVTAAVGYPTIITKASHGLNDGDVVTLSDFAGEDAALLNGKTVVIKNVTENTLAFDIDTTGKTLTAANGTLTPVEWTAIGEVTDFSGPDGTATEIDTTHLLSDAKEYLMGLPDEGNFTLSINWEPTDVGQATAIAARKARAEKNFKVTYSDDSTATFKGYILGLSSSGAVDGKIDGSITIRITDEVIWA